MKETQDHPIHNGTFTIYATESGFETSMLAGQEFKSPQEVIEGATRWNASHKRRGSDPQALHVLYVQHDGNVSIHIVPYLFVAPEIVKLLSLATKKITIQNDYGFSTQGIFSKEENGDIIETYHGAKEWPNKTDFTHIRVKARMESAEGPIAEIDAVTRRSANIVNTMIAEIASMQLFHAASKSLSKSFRLN